MSKYDKLLDARVFADAKAILETEKREISSTQSTLLQTAYQIRETQPNVATNFIKTVIQEMDHEDEKVEETEDNSNHQSSSTTGLEQIGTDHGDGEKPVDGVSDPKDQTGVPIGEMAPMPPQQIPPQGGMPPAQAPQQQMQYTVQEATAIRSNFAKIMEAIKKLDTKITETQNAQIKSVPVGVGESGTSSSGKFMIRETLGSTDVTDSMVRLNNAINDGTA